MASSKIKLKLLVDIKAKKIVFAEAGKDFIDFLIHLLSLPLVTVVRLLKENNMMGSLGSLHLYESFQILPDAYFQQNQFKSSLLYPRLPIDSSGIPLKLSGIGSYPKSYFCPTNHPYVANVPNLLCPSCRQKMTREWNYVPPSPMNTEVPDGGGFVKGLVPYIVIDNLEYRSMSTKQVTTLLNKLSVQEVSALEEEVVVDVGVNEGLKLLKASMECKTVLTSVFFEDIGKMKTTKF